jgi:hypothetical protein
MPADFNFADRANLALRRQHGDLEANVFQFLGADGIESRVRIGHLLRKVRYEIGQRQVRRKPSEASAQLAPAEDGHEGRLRKIGADGVRPCDTLAMHPGNQRIMRDPQQLMATLARQHRRYQIVAAR